MPRQDKKERAAKPSLLRRLKKHLDGDPARLPVIQHELASYERPNLHLAIDELLAAPERETTLVGVIVPSEHQSVTLSKLSRKATASNFDEGPIEYVDVALANERRLSCVKRGLYCFRDDGHPVAMLLSEKGYPFKGIVLEVMATDRDRGERFVRRVTRETRYGKAFRGQILSLEQDCFNQLSIRFHRFPEIRREEIILPEAILERIERHTIGFSRHAERLRAAGRHLKRGILLHAPPGTGKTLSAMYLASQMSGRTVLLLTGAGMNAIESACALARMLEPATLILEDVDLIGTHRDDQTVDANALLFELLNQMDGLGDDADILFVLTTNRPDILEPALASRPGRIDQAIEIPPPDDDCRRRLLDLYGVGLQLEISDYEKLIARMRGVSGAFIRELLRKAAVLAAEESTDESLRVRDQHLEEALAELLITGGALTQSLLGAHAASRNSEQAGQQS